MRNIAFDVTPAEYVTAIITEKGAFKPRDLKELSRQGAEIDKIRIKN